jgi:hypothetical protein
VTRALQFLFLAGKGEAPPSEARYPGPVDRLTRRVAEDVKTAYKLERDMHTETNLTQLIPDELVQRFAFAGSPEVIKEQINGESSALMK